MHKHHFCVSNS